MILPGSQALSLALLIVAMLCWSVWPSTFKLAGKWRFELFYLDFAIGLGFAAAIAALTFGSMGWDGFSVVDDLRLAGKRHDLMAFLAGCVFNLGNMLLVAAVSVAGISFSLLISMGMALVASAIFAFAAHPEGSILLLGAGCVAALAAVVLGTLGYKEVSTTRLALAPEPGKKVTKRSFSFKGAVVAIFGGLLLGSFYPLLTMASTGEDGLGPYSSTFIFAAGVFLSTIVFDLFFMNLPIQGKPLEVAEYLRGSARQHMMGFAGGVLFLIGMLVLLIITRVDAVARPTPLFQFLLPRLATLFAVGSGIIVWKELAGVGERGKMFVTGMLFLYAAGLALLSAVPS